MPKNYQAVQAGHAVAEFMLECPNAWKNETLVYLKVKDKVELEEWSEKLHEMYIIRAPFYEPDLGDEITAVAVLSNPQVDELFCKMQLI
jgi:predicted HAD superfamily phosphohydrolase